MKKNITKFPTIASYQDFLASGECPIFNVSYIEETNKNEYVIYEAPAAAKTPFYFEFLNSLDVTQTDCKIYFEATYLTSSGDIDRYAWGCSANIAYKTDNENVWHTLHYDNLNHDYYYLMKDLQGFTSSTTKVYLKLVSLGSDVHDLVAIIPLLRTFDENNVGSNVRIGGNPMSVCTTKEDFYNVEPKKRQYCKYAEYTYMEHSGDKNAIKDLSQLYIMTPTLSEHEYDNMLNSVVLTTAPTFSFKGAAAEGAFAEMYRNATITNPLYFDVEIISSDSSKQVNLFNNTFVFMLLTDASNIKIKLKNDTGVNLFFNTMAYSSIIHGPVISIDNQQNTPADTGIVGQCSYLEDITLLGNYTTRFFSSITSSNTVLYVDSTKTQAEADTMLATVYPEYNETGWTAQPLSA